MYYNGICKAIFIVSSVICLSCSSDEKKYDLPSDWKGAVTVVDFTQGSCSESEEDLPSGFNVTYDENKILIEVSSIGFRCSQPVEAFQIEKESEIRILIQPIEMDPENVAACDCDYDIYMSLDNSELEEPTVRVYQRGDNFAGGTAVVEVQQN